MGNLPIENEKRNKLIAVARGIAAGGRYYLSMGWCFGWCWPGGSVVGWFDGWSDAGAWAQQAPCRNFGRRFETTDGNRTLIKSREPAAMLEIALQGEYKISQHSNKENSYSHTHTLTGAHKMNCILRENSGTFITIEINLLQYQKIHLVQQLSHKTLKRFFMYLYFFSSLPISFSALADTYTNRVNSGCSLLFKAHLQLALFQCGSGPKEAISGAWRRSGQTHSDAMICQPPTKHAPDASKAVRRGLFSQLARFADLDALKPALEHG